MPEPTLTPPEWFDGPPCPVCSRPAIRVRDEDGRWVWVCTAREHNDKSQGEDDE